MSHTRASAILFDLDGTLSDPFVGIARSYRHLLERLSVEIPPDVELRSFVGPPIRTTLDSLLGPDPVSNHEPSVAIFREYFAEIGLFENTPYEGVDRMLERVGSAYPMYVCTSKPTVYAERILEKFGFAKYFRAIYGCELDGTRGNKAELLAWLLERESLQAAGIVLIGDRLHDMRAAVMNGARGAGVLWGYGSDKELRDAGASRLFAHPDEVTPDAVRAILTPA